MRLRETMIYDIVTQIHKMIIVSSSPRNQLPNHGLRAGAKYGEKEKAEIWDGNCGVEECALCGLPNPTAKMRVRGHCKKGSIFDKEYYFVIMENGKQAYLGRYFSLISYNEQQNLWMWTDSKDANSKGIDLF